MITITIDREEQSMLTYLISAAIGNTLKPEESIVPRLNTYGEVRFLIDLLGRINGTEDKK